MLVLSRLINESIMIGDDIEIKVAMIRGGTIRLAIMAPREILVYRKEIYEKIQDEKRGTKNEAESRK